MAEHCLRDPWSIADPSAIYSQLSSQAQSAISQTNTALDTLAAFIDTLAGTTPSTGIDFDAPTAVGEIAPIPDIGDGPDDITMLEPDPIGEITCFSPQDPGDPPTDDIGTAPVYEAGQKPGDLDATVPDEPTIDYDVISVDEPTYAEPTSPDLITITIPSEPDIDWPTLDLDEPTWLGPDYPDYGINYTEPGYTSDLLDAVQTKLLDWIQNGGTGLIPDIESRIWDRARSREDQNSFRVKKKLTIEYPASGWAYPVGGYYEALLEAEQDAQNKIADLSREIAIKQAELEQSNMHFAIENSIKYEALLIDYYHKVQDRALQAQKIIAELSVQVYQTYIERYKADMQLYQTQASVYEAQLRAELGKLEIFKAQIDAQRLIGDVNKLEIEAYIAQWNAVKTQADIFNTKVSYAKALLEAEALKAQVYKTQIEAYSEEVKAYEAEWRAYSEEIKAEVSKVSFFEAKADAYAKRVQGWAAKAGTYVEQDKLQLENINIFLKKYEAYVDLVKSYNDARIGNYTAQVGYYNAQAERAKAVGQNNEAIGRQEMAQSLAKQEEVKWELEKELVQSQENIKNLIEIDKMIGDTAKALATISAQLATAAYSALHIGINSQIGQSQSYNCNVSHSYTEE